MSHQHGKHQHEPHEHGHQHAGHQHGHGSIRFAGATSAGRTVHRLGRRRFLTDLGRNTFAVALIGGFAAACSGDDDAGAPDVATSDSAATGAPPTAVTSSSTRSSAVPSSTDPGTTAASTTDDAVAATSVPRDMLRWEQADLGFVSAYVLVRGNTAAVVDTGTAGRRGSDRRDAATLLGVTYDEVRHVVLTHSSPRPHRIASGRDAARRIGGDVRRRGSTSRTITAPTESSRSATATTCSDSRSSRRPATRRVRSRCSTPASVSWSPATRSTATTTAPPSSGPNAQFTADMATANAVRRQAAALRCPGGCVRSRPTRPQRRRRPAADRGHRLIPARASRSPGW